MVHPLVSVLVPVRNEAGHIRQAIGAMRAQRFDEDVEFLLLHGDSKDATLTELAAAIDGDPRFRLFEVDGLNVPQRLNLGLQAAGGELIARMDAHALFPPTYLADGVRRLERGDVASVSGPQIALGTGAWGRRVALALRSRLGRGGAQFRHLSAGEIEVDSGYCGIWRRSLLVDHGGWEELATGAEDTELATRIRRAGGRIVCVPEMAARYQPRETLRGLAQQYGRYGYRRAWVARRYPETLRRSQLLPPGLVVAVVCAAVGPRPAARAARRGVGLYAGAVATEAVRLGRGQPPGDVVALPVVFATMHLAWGTGFLASCLRHGPPSAALAQHVTGVSPGRRARP